MTRPSQTLAQILPRILVRLSGILAMALFATGVSTTGFSGEAVASCTSIGSSTFCGTRGSHNTVGRTVIFNTGRAGQRIGSGFVGTGSPSRVSNVIGRDRGRLAAPRGFGGNRARQTFASSGVTDSRIAALRAEILALEAEAQLMEMERENLGLTPAEREAWANMPPALRKALKLTKTAKADAQPSPTLPAAN